MTGCCIKLDTWVGIIFSVHGLYVRDDYAIIVLKFLCIYYFYWLLESKLQCETCEVWIETSKAIFYHHIHHQRTCQPFLEWKVATSNSLSLSLPPVKQINKFSKCVSFVSNGPLGKLCHILTKIYCWWYRFLFYFFKKIRLYVILLVISLPYTSKKILIIF